MKRIIFALTFILFLMPFYVKAEEVNVYVFYGDGCPHCAELEEYLTTGKNKNEISLYKYEVWFNEENEKLWEKVQSIMNTEAKGVPYFIIGDKVYQGYNKTASWEEAVDNAIKYAKENSYSDEVGVFLGVVNEADKYKEGTKDENKIEKEEEKKEEKKEINTKLDVPLIGEVNLKDLSLPVIAILIGLVDGFNPCAMWILIFLITMLLGYKDRTKMWILGLTFLFTSAFIYSLFMMSFLKVATFINTIAILRTLVAIFAFIFGLYNIYRYIKTRKTDGCDVVNKDSRKKIMVRIKEAISSKSFIASLIGIISIAIAVNLIELLCSLGLPVMFTEILALNNVTGLSKTMYILLYVLFFLLDDLIIFFIAMKTLKIAAISNKYTKYSHLIGGLIMILIGVLMLVKPEWLMFNF